MLSSITDAWYFPNLKAKYGECRALQTVRPPVRAKMAPICIVPPASFDPELGRTPAPLEHLRLFGHRLAAWGRNIIFVDAGLVDDAQHRAAVETHPLTELVERAHLMNALACPLTTLQASSEYQEAVRRFAEWRKPLPVCLRISASDLESRSLADNIEQLLAVLGVDERRVVLLIDFNLIVLPPEVEAVEAFVNLLIDRINGFPKLHDWLAIAVASTSFPQEIKGLKAGDIGRFARTDWDAYRRLFQLRGQLIRTPAFSDYAVESLAFLTMGPVAPSAQFRYTTPDEYLLVKGPNTSKAGYEAIFDVARRLVVLPEFMGAEFSDGDEYIAHLASAPESTGNASLWRWASTDHHLTFVMASVGKIRGLEIETRLPVEPHQLSLLADVR